MKTLLGGLVFAAFLLAHVSAVIAIHAGGKDHEPNASCGRATLPHGIWSACVALAALLLSFTAYSQDLNGIAHQFLQRHGVPCRFVLKVGSPYDLGEVATCEDGRVWALFWLENEIAFIHPQTREAYKWDRQIYLSHPEIYFEPDPNNERQVLVSNGR